MGSFGTTGASDARDGWRPVYDFWFPAALATIDAEGYGRMLARWFGGGTNAELPPFAPLVDAAASGALDAWLATPRGRLSLILVLDQFPRGLWPGTPRAFAHDPLALRLAEEGIRSGDYDALPHPWEKTFFSMPLVHAEGPDHLERMDRMIALAEARLAACPPHLRAFADSGVDRGHWVRDVIRRFGRHPHRNDALGRASTPEEAAYVATGVFSHNAGATPPPRPKPAG